MKLMVLIFSLLALTFSLAALEIGLGYDVSLKHQIVPAHDYNHFDEYKVENGFSPYIECLLDHRKFYKASLGVEYQIPKNLDGKNEVGTGWMNYIPVYLSNKISIPVNSGSANFILLGNIGYNFLNAQKEYLGNKGVAGGLYFGVGGGFDFSRVPSKCSIKKTEALSKAILTSKEWSTSKWEYLWG
jgi:hypothetical protein